MKIYNKEKNKILDNPDLEKGYLIDDKIIIGHQLAQNEVEEKYHYEVVKEYPNGGKDVEKIIDVHYSPAIPEQDIYEDIKVYIPFTTKELNNIEYNKLKNWFDSEYTYKEQKFRRLIALNKLDDDGIDAKTKLTELYIEAESKRTKIQMLENEV